MFGYIDLNPKKLTPEQTGRYKAWYCGLCREIRNRYGQLGRMVLSNDMTFLTVLLSSLYEPEEESGSANCPLHPVRKRAFIQSSATAYAADMNLLLAYWKYRDAERDRERGIQKQLASRLNSAYDEICKAYPEQAAGVEKALEQIWAMEDGQEPDVDRLCALSGDMLGSVFAPKEDVFAPVLREIGKGLGKFVYLMDAYEDYEKDIKKGRFNPLNALQGPGYEELIRDSLTGSRLPGSSSRRRAVPTGKRNDSVIIYQQSLFKRGTKRARVPFPCQPHSAGKEMLPKSNMSPMVKVWPLKASTTSLRRRSKDLLSRLST